MPARGLAQTSPVEAFIELASDPKSYGEKLKELADRTLKAEKAERRAAKAAEKLSEREAALVERTEKVQAREVDVQAREDCIVVKEKSAAEQIEVADALVVQSRERESSVEGRETDLERRAAEAICAVRELVKK